jgi:hypothetical protein
MKTNPNTRTKKAERLFGKKKEQKVYMGPSGLTAKEMIILRDQGRVVRCPDAIPEDTKY